MSIINCYYLIDVAERSDLHLGRMSHSGSAHVENFQPPLLFTKQQFTTLSQHAVYSVFSHSQCDLSERVSEGRSHFKYEQPESLTKIKSIFND